MNHSPVITAIDSYPRMLLNSSILWCPWNKLKNIYDCLYNIRKIIHVRTKYKKLNSWTKIAEIEIHCKSGCSREEIYKKNKKHPNSLWKILEEKRSCTIRPATMHQCTSASRYFLPPYEYHMLNNLSWYLQYIYICINKHGKALSLISVHPLSAF